MSDVCDMIFRPCHVQRVTKVRLPSVHLNQHQANASSCYRSCSSNVTAAAHVAHHMYSLKGLCSSHLLTEACVAGQSLSISVLLSYAFSPSCHGWPCNHQASERAWPAQHLECLAAQLAGDICSMCHQTAEMAQQDGLHSFGKAQAQEGVQQPGDLCRKLACLASKQPSLEQSALQSQQYE